MRAQQTYHPAAGPIEDPVYANPDFAAENGSGIMRKLASWL